MKRRFLQALNYMAKMVESSWVDLQGRRAVNSFPGSKHTPVPRSHHLQALFFSLPSSRNGGGPALLEERDKVGPVPGLSSPPLLRPDRFYQSCSRSCKVRSAFAFFRNSILLLRDVNRPGSSPRWKTTGFKAALSSPPKLGRGGCLILSFFLVWDHRVEFSSGSIERTSLQPTSWVSRK